MNNYVPAEEKMKKDHKNMSLGEMAEEALKKAVARVVERNTGNRGSRSPFGGMEKSFMCPPISFRGMRRRQEANLSRQEMRGELPRIRLGRYACQSSADPRS